VLNIGLELIEETILARNGMNPAIFTTVIHPVIRIHIRFDGQNLKLDE
jgi:hypothetical protein